MNLEWKSFSYAWELINFVNEQHISKEAIQTIVVNPSGRFYLYYWKD